MISLPQISQLQLAPVRNALLLTYQTSLRLINYRTVSCENYTFCIHSYQVIEYTKIPSFKVSLIIQQRNTHL